MGENKELKDSELKKAAGGLKFDEHGMPIYDAYGVVVKYLDNQMYLVRLDDGGEVEAHFEYRHYVEEGTRVGLTALMGGWEMDDYLNRDF